MTAAFAIELVLNTVSGLNEEGDSVSKYFSQAVKNVTNTTEIIPIIFFIFIIS